MPKVPGSADDDQRELDEADQIRLRAIEALDSTVLFACFSGTSELVFAVLF